MSSPARSVVSPKQLLSTLRRHFFVWAAPTVVLTVLAIGYAVVRPTKWRASQALVVRDEATSSGTTRQGRFDTSEAMKNAQETLVQMSHNPTMVEAALVEAGPIDGESPDEWPTKADIDELQDSISISPPKGGEFGRNEVIYLSVQAPTRERAVVLTTAVGNQLERELQELRRTRARSLITELEKGLALAQSDLAAATKSLQATEKSVGRDLDELRSLTETNAGGSNLRSTSNQLKEEIRRTQLLHDGNTEQLKLLADAQQDENPLMAVPQRLFDQQPALKRLKDGLVDAQLRTAQLAGKMTPNHPEVKAATFAENEIRRQLNDEIELVVRNLENDLKVSAGLLKTLNERNAEVDGRLNQVAALRATYANQLAEVRQRSETLSKIIQDLSNVRASQEAASSASLIARLDKPQPDGSPVGPSFPMIVAAGFGGGLMLGLGIVFLIAPLGNLWGRRWSDYAGSGRRGDDKRGAASVDPSRPPQRRESDVKQPPAPSRPPQRREGDVKQPQATQPPTTATVQRPATPPAAQQTAQPALQQTAKPAAQHTATGAAPAVRAPAPPTAVPTQGTPVPVVRVPAPLPPLEPLAGTGALPSPLPNPK